MRVIFKAIHFLLTVALVFTSCNTKEKYTVHQQEEVSKDWKTQFNQSLPVLGHRNWIVVADKAFPKQNAAGMQVINTNENLLPVLQYVLQQVNGTSHVKPTIFRDKELQYITEEQAKGVKEFERNAIQLFGGQEVQTILHDSVFTKLDNASKLFTIVVLKTNETIPYTSVFLELDCAYWNAEKERELRVTMKNSK